jgi:hypothetical protein
MERIGCHVELNMGLGGVAMGDITPASRGGVLYHVNISQRSDDVLTDTLFQVINNNAAAFNND